MVKVSAGRDSFVSRETYQLLHSLHPSKSLFVRDAGPSRLAGSIGIRNASEGSSEGQIAYTWDLLKW